MHTHLVSAFSYLSILLFASDASASILPVASRQSQPQPPSNLNNNQLTASYQAQCSAAGTSVGHDAIQSDIASTTSGWQSINFQMSNNKNIIVPMCTQWTPSIGPLWASISTTWSNVLWSSRTTALNTAAYATQFNNQIMPLIANQTGTSMPITLSQQVLANYSTMATALESSAQATATAFATLGASLDSYYAMAQQCLKIMAANHVPPPRIPRRRALSTSQIDALQTQIAGYTTQLSALGAAMQTTPLSTSEGVDLFPGFASGVLVPGVAAVADPTAYKTIATNLASAQSQLQNGLASSGLNAELTQNFHTQVTSMTSVWNAVRSDCEEVTEFIGFAEGFAAIPLIFWKTMNNVTCMYEPMDSGLQIYANGVASSGIPPSKRDVEAEDFEVKLLADVHALVEGAKAMAETGQF